MTYNVAVFAVEIRSPWLCIEQLFLKVLIPIQLKWRGELRKRTVRFHTYFAIPFGAQSAQHF